VSFIVAIVASVENGPVISGVLSIIFGCLSGVMDYPLFLKNMSFGFWGAQVLMDCAYENIAAVMRDTLSTYGWSRGKNSSAFAALLASALGWYAIGGVLLVSWNRRRQR
jgi:hypothetical protein